MLRLLNIVDEFTREALVMHVGRSITAEQTVTVLRCWSLSAAAQRTSAVTTGRADRPRAARLVHQHVGHDQLHEPGAP